MSGFKFKARNLLFIEIEDKKYEVEFREELLNKIQTLCVKLEKESKGAKDGDKIKLKQLCNLCSEGIDSILGEDAHKEIFSDRKINFVDCCDVLIYIFEEIAQYKNKKLSDYNAILNQTKKSNDYASKIPKNREQRRKFNKKKNKSKK